ncbi:syntaxin binding protein 6 (amisyn), like isoform X1 [Corythoichthys intestinalis]|uniref:syntaxin binding protein 6 (amisyn), like isoform X1 n=1 Tax=Corythoichthys intestinalis TaxID=161448 RepID=UPI0025A5BC24|nr:syntaxin binding protein 6 (amisyn), like isoform X1 [Corythoichthys intestinalis]
MTIQSTINKEVFIPCNERMLVAVEVQRRKKKRMSFLSPGSKGNYATFICVSVTNTRPQQLLISKVKHFSDSLAFTRTSQWMVEQLQQVDGINPDKDSPEFDLVFINAVDQWAASTAAEKCILVHVLYRACQTYWGAKTGSHVKVKRKGSHQVGVVDPSDSSPGPSSGRTQARRKSLVVPRLPEFINCASKLTKDSSNMTLFIYRCKALLVHMRNKMNAKQRRAKNRVPQIKMSLGERGDKLTEAEDKTVGLVHTTKQLADIAHKIALKRAK